MGYPALLEQMAHQAPPEQMGCQALPEQMAHLDLQGLPVLMAQ